MGFFKRESNFISYTIDKGITNNLAISIQNGQVAVTAPWYFSQKQIDRVIVNRKKWILQKIKDYEEKNRIKKSNLKSEFVKVFGDNYCLNISYKCINNPELTLNNKVINVVMPIKYKNVENIKIVNFVVDRFYNKLAEKEVEFVLEKIRYILGIAPDDYKIQKIGNKLGIYKEENKNIVINPEIVKYSKEIFEYVVLHEVCHLKYKTHVKNFYKMIEQVMPNYKCIESEIKGMF